MTATPDGNRLAMIDEGSLRVFDTATSPDDRSYARWRGSRRPGSPFRRTESRWPRGGPTEKFSSTI